MNIEKLLNKRVCVVLVQYICSIVKAVLEGSEAAMASLSNKVLELYYNIISIIV